MVNVRNMCERFKEKFWKLLCKNTRAILRKLEEHLMKKYDGTRN